MFATSRANLTEAWRWQAGLSLNDFPGLNGGVVGPDGHLLLAGSISIPIESDVSTYGSIFPLDTPLTASAFAVFKLDGRTKNELWEFVSETTDRVDKAFAIDVDANGDLIVAGSTSGSRLEDDTSSTEDQTYTAFKLDGDTGQQLWYYGSTSSDDDPNVTDTALSNGTGDVLGVAVDSNGNGVFVGQIWGSWVEGSGEMGDSDYTIGKLNGDSGSLIWAVQGGPSGSYDAFLACAVDLADNILAAGLTEGDVAATNAGGSDHLVVKFDADGQELWSWQNGTESEESLLAVTVDGDDNAYVAGRKGDGNETSDSLSTGIVLKLNGSNGNELWRFTSDDAYVFRGIDVDDAGGLVVAAGTLREPGLLSSTVESETMGYNFFAVALDIDSGEELGRWHAGSPSSDELYFAQFDAAGALYLGGYSKATAWNSATGSVFPESSDIAVVKFEPDGYEFPASTAQGGDDYPPADDILHLIVAIVAVATIFFICCIACALHRVRRTTYLSKTVEDFSSVLVAGPGSSAGPSSSASTVRRAASPRFRSGKSLASSWLANPRRASPGQTSKRTLCVTRLFAGAPDSPMALAPRCTPQQKSSPLRDTSTTSPIEAEAAKASKNDLAHVLMEEGHERCARSRNASPPSVVRSLAPQADSETYINAMKSPGLQPGLLSYDSAAESTVQDGTVRTDVASGHGLTDHGDVAGAVGASTTELPSRDNVRHPLALQSNPEQEAEDLQDDHASRGATEDLSTCSDFKWISAEGRTEKCVTRPLDPPSAAPTPLVRDGLGLGSEHGTGSALLGSVQGSPVRFSDLHVPGIRRSDCADAQVSAEIAACRPRQCAPVVPVMMSASFTDSACDGAVEELRSPSAIAPATRSDSAAASTFGGAMVRSSSTSRRDDIQTRDAHVAAAPIAATQRSDSAAGSVYRNENNGAGRSGLRGLAALMPRAPRFGYAGRPHLRETGPLPKRMTSVAGSLTLSDEVETLPGLDPVVHEEEKRNSLHRVTSWVTRTDVFDERGRHKPAS